MERANLINDTRLIIERADGTIENITTDKFGTGMEANSIIPDLSPNPVPVARIITPQKNAEEAVIALSENETMQILQAQMAELLRENGDLRAVIFKLRGLQEQGQNHVQLQAQNQTQDQEQAKKREVIKKSRN